MQILFVLLFFYLSQYFHFCFRLLIVCLCWILAAVLTIEPSWSSYFIGEFVTFKCDMNEGRDTDWYYTINKDGRDFVRYSEYKVYTLEMRSTDHSGKYQCYGSSKGSHYTKNSNTVSVTVLGKSSAQITSDMRDIPVGGSVTLTCSVNSSSSSGWKYYWYRDEKSSEALTTQDAVFHSNGQISVSQEGLYKCRGGRGNPVYYTEDSQSVRIDRRVNGVLGISSKIWTRASELLESLSCSMAASDGEKHNVPVGFWSGDCGDQSVVSIP
uniref:Ig-like domain-containing protein n=1 Tax=Haplochromis burtoni TaxID=8153 RepID=A0A3Q2VN44_HAPBU